MPRRARKQVGASMARPDLMQKPNVGAGLPYGERQQLLSAQQAVPLPGPGAAAPSPLPAPASGPGPDTGHVTPAAPPNAFEAAQGMEPPDGALFGAPSERPDEPLTAGMAMGAGPGPSPLGTATPDPLAAAAAVLAQLGDDDADVAFLKGLVQQSIANRAAL